MKLTEISNKRKKLNYTYHYKVNLCAFKNHKND